MGVGDGGGTPYQPYAEQTGLVNELYRAPLNRLVIADSGANVIRAEMVMFPGSAGSGCERPRFMMMTGYAWR